MKNFITWRFIVAYPFVLCIGILAVIQFITVKLSLLFEIISVIIDYVGNRMLNAVTNWAKRPKSHS